MEITGVFAKDLEIYLSDNKGHSGASRQSQVDIKKIAIKGNGILQKGKMYAFQYFTKLEKQSDSFPIVIGLGNNGKNQLGLNLHYMPYNARIQFLKELTKSLESQITLQLKDNKLGNPNIQSQIDSFTWNNLNESFGKKYNLQYCIRQYNLNNMINVYNLGYEHWYLGAVNDENSFIGGNINTIQSLFYKNI